MSGLQGLGWARFNHQQEERDLRAKALEEQKNKNQGLHENGGLVRDDQLLGGIDHANSGLFKDDEVIVEQLTLSESVDKLRDDSTKRLGEGRGKVGKVLHRILGFLPMVALAVIRVGLGAVGLVVNTVFGGGAKLLGKALGMDDWNNEFTSEWRQKLGGQPMPGSILGKGVTFENQAMSLPEAMETVRERLGSKVSKQEMMEYVAMGEKIVHALSKMGDRPPPTNVTLDHEGGQVRVRSDLETARAISWYLQAKALVDNQEYDAGGYVKEGAMITKDPGGKLFNFLQSSNNTYGRVSTHMEERSESRPQGLDLNVFSTAWKGGVDGVVFSGWYGQPLQYGIEDYDDRMPSKGGSLLFDKLKPSGGDDDTVPELYLKWENVGTPFSFGGGSSSTGLITDDMWNQNGALGRFITHTRGAHGNADPVGYRGEKIDKGKAGEFYNELERLVDELPEDEELTKDVKKNLLKHVKTYGALEMNKALDLLLERGYGKDLEPEEIKPIKEDDQIREYDVPEKSFKARNLEHLKVEFNTWQDEQGPNLGIQRKGQEVHVQLTGTVPDRHGADGIILHEV